MKNATQSKPYIGGISFTNGELINLIKIHDDLFGFIINLNYHSAYWDIIIWKCVFHVRWDTETIITWNMAVSITGFNSKISMRLIEPECSHCGSLGFGEIQKVICSGIITNLEQIKITHLVGNHLNYLPC